MYSRKMFGGLHTTIHYKTNRPCLFCYNTSMYEERNMTPIIVAAVFVVLLTSAGIWYVIGRGRIIKPVPDGDTSSRVILVTPRATPTSVLSPEKDASESAKDDKEEEPTPTKKPAVTAVLTTNPTAKPTVKPSVALTTTPVASPSASE